MYLNEVHHISIMTTLKNSTNFFSCDAQMLLLQLPQISHLLYLHVIKVVALVIIVKFGNKLSIYLSIYLYDFWISFYILWETTAILPNINNTGFLTAIITPCKQKSVHL